MRAALRESILLLLALIISAINSYAIAQPQNKPRTNQQNYSKTTEPASCKTIRFADPSWTDISATTGIATVILQALGYQTEVKLLSVPVTYASLSNGDIDVFLGYWNPSMTPDLQPYLDNGSVEILRYNLTDAKYTLAVPQLAYDNGLKNFSDIARFGNGLEHKIYGVEPGNDGNRTIMTMIKDDAFGLKDFKIIETSEQAMLAEVAAKISEKKPVVFLGWEPHPMNMHLKMAYLAGGDAYFGENYGSAKIGTNIRKNYAKECPNIGQFLQNLEFSSPMENAIMAGILEDKLEPQKAALAFLKNNRQAINPWLENVSTFNGKDAKEAVNAVLDKQEIAKTTREHTSFIGNFFNEDLHIAKIPVGKAANIVVEWLKNNAHMFFETIRLALDWLLSSTLYIFLLPHPFILIAILGLLAFILQRKISSIFLTLAGFLFVMNQGYWLDTMETLTLLLWSCILCMGIGVPIGIYSAHHPRFYRFIQPILDLMQTLPTFVYLIPAIIFFRIGMVPGLIATIIFVMPAPIRLSQQGIFSTPKNLIEAGIAFGGNRRQILWKIEMPHAMPQIRASMTQTIMLSLSMVVIAATVGGNGLGVKVYRALQQNDAALGFEAGFVIVVVAIVLDRLFRPQKTTKSEK